MIRIAILNKDSFYSKLLTVKLSKLFPEKIKRVIAFETEEEVIENLDAISKFDLIIIGDGICKDYKQLVRILLHTKCIANSKRFYLNKKMIDSGAHWMIEKDIIFNSYGTVNESLEEWSKPLNDWFF